MMTKDLIILPVQNRRTMTLSEDATNEPEKRYSVV